MVSGFPWNPPHLRDCVGASPSDDAAPLPGISLHTFLRMKDAGLPVSSSATQLLVRSARGNGERLSLRSIETPIQSNVFPLRPLGSFQVIHSLAALQLHLRMRGGILGTFVLKSCEPEGSRTKMVPPPLYFSSENILNVESERVMLTGGVPGVCAASP